MLGGLDDCAGADVDFEFCGEVLVGLLVFMGFLAEGDEGGIGGFPGCEVVFWEDC